MKIGECSLGKKPRIVAVVDEIAPVGKLELLRGEADILEMRVDCYNQTLEHIVNFLGDVRLKVKLPMIGTVRENDTTRLHRVDYFKAIMPFVDAIDIELGAPISDAVVAAAKGKLIIVSEHDFTLMPNDEALAAMVDRSKKQGADIIKIAAMANNRDDVVRLMQFTHASTDPIITIAMGSHGSISRVIAPLFGSLFSYGYLTKPVAPGQLSVTKLVEEFRNYYFD